MAVRSAELTVVPEHGGWPAPVPLRLAMHTAFVMTGASRLPGGGVSLQLAASVNTHDLVYEKELYRADRVSLTPAVVYGSSQLL